MYMMRLHPLCRAVKHGWPRWCLLDWQCVMLFTYDHIVLFGTFGRVQCHDCSLPLQWTAAFQKVSIVPGGFILWDNSTRLLLEKFVDFGFWKTIFKIFLKEVKWNKFSDSFGIICISDRYDANNRARLHVCWISLQPDQFSKILI